MNYACVTLRRKRRKLIKKTIEIQINDCVEVDVTEEEFTEEFISWLESKGWFFGGGINQYKEDKE